MGALTKHKLTVDTASIATSDQVAAYLVDSAGDLLTSTLIGSDQALDVNMVGATGMGIYAEDSVHVTADLGQQILAVRNDTLASLVSADGDYAPMQVNANGALYVDVIDTSFGINAEYAEDSVHTTGDIGVFQLVVRSDSKASTAGTDGDYAALIQDADGDLYVTDTVAQGYLATIDTDTGSIATDASTIAGAVSGTEMQVDIISASGQYAEDSAHSSADIGNQILAVRNDTLASLVDTDGDYAPMQVNANGALYVDVIDTSFGINAEYAEDSAHTTADIGVFNLAVAAHGAFAANHSADGDYAAFMVDAYGRLIVNSSPNVAAKNSNSIVGTSAAEVVATPLPGRTKLLIQNLGNKDVYVGHSAAVTTANGTLVPADGDLTLEWGADIDVFMISGSTGQDVRFLETA